MFFLLNRRCPYVRSVATRQTRHHPLQQQPSPPPRGRDSVNMNASPDGCVIDGNHLPDGVADKLQPAQRRGHRLVICLWGELPCASGLILWSNDLGGHRHLCIILPFLTPFFPPTLISEDALATYREAVFRFWVNVFSELSSWLHLMSWILQAAGRGCWARYSPLASSNSDWTGGRPEWLPSWNGLRIWVSSPA